MDFGNGADRGTRVVRGGFLLNRNGRRQTFDMIQIRLFHYRQKLTRVGGQRFNIAPLAFSKNGVKRQRRLTRAGEAGNYNQLIAGQVQVYVFEIMRASAAQRNFIHQFSPKAVNYQK